MSLVVERSVGGTKIHDELGQACTAIKMDLALIGRKATKRQTQLRAKVDAAMQLVDEMIFTLRRIASELRPRTLDDLGLTAALECRHRSSRPAQGFAALSHYRRNNLPLFRTFDSHFSHLSRIANQCGAPCSSHAG